MKSLSIAITFTKFKPSTRTWVISKVPSVLTLAISPVEFENRIILLSLPVLPENLTVEESKMSLSLGLSKNTEVLFSLDFVSMVVDVFSGLFSMMAFGCLCHSQNIRAPIMATEINIRR